MSVILKARIDWMEGYGNSPDLEVLVDKVQPPEAFRYEERQGLHYGVADGEVRFFSGGDRGVSDGGFGGRQFPITMKDGTEKVLMGPWSSRASAMHSVGFPPCVEVRLTDDPAAFERRHTFVAGCLALGCLMDYRSVIERTPFRTGTGWSGWTGKIEFNAGCELVIARCELDQRSKPIYPWEKADRPLTGEWLYLPVIKLPNGEMWRKPD